MILVILYGPPAVGKLTVGIELAKLTGYKLFHNHLTRDPVRELFGPDSPQLKSLVPELRRILLGAAAQAKLSGVIFTYVYFKTEDDADIQSMMAAVKPHGGQTNFVQLTCEVTEIRRRLVLPERQERFRKLGDLVAFDKTDATHDMTSPVPFEPNFVVDTTHTPPAETARLIQAHYQLPTVEEGQ